VNVPRPRLLIATSSGDKLRELREILDDLDTELVSLRDVGIELEVEESGSTFRENAEIKARAYWQASGLPTLAEDSGFEVDALGGAPGVQSARWEGSDYRRKNRLIIERLAAVTGSARRCRYVCEIAYLDRDGALHRSRGELEGQVAQAPAGRGGFGYDPIFLLPDLGRTLAELAPPEKHARSHRGKAGRAIRPVVARTMLP
jgi:XTP/dITP diphosphohydrolase